MTTSRHRGDPTDNECYAMEMRGEVLSTIAAANEQRYGALDRLEIGSGSGEHGSTDVVAGTETVTVDGDLTETVGRERTNAMHNHILTVHGHKHVEALQETDLLTGSLNETHHGGQFLAAGMSDDLIAGIGVRTTAPADLWLNGLIGMEEKLATANNDVLMMDVYAVGMEREFGTSIHNMAVSSIGGAVYTTMANGFMQLHQMQRGLRNAVPGGGGGSGSSGNAPAGTPAPTSAPPPAPTSASTPVTDGGASNIASIARTGRGVDDLASAEDLANARQATEAVETSGTVRPNVAETLQNLRDADEAARQGGDDAAAAALRRAAEELTETSIDEFEDAAPGHRHIADLAANPRPQADSATDAATGRTATDEGTGYSPSTPVDAHDASHQETFIDPNAVYIPENPHQGDGANAKAVDDELTQERARLQARIEKLGEEDPYGEELEQLSHKAEAHDHILKFRSEGKDPVPAARARIQDAETADDFRLADAWEETLERYEELLQEYAGEANRTDGADPAPGADDLPPLPPGVDAASVDDTFADLERQLVAAIQDLSAADSAEAEANLTSLYDKLHAYGYIRRALEAGQDPAPGIKRFIEDADDFDVLDIWSDALDQFETALQANSPSTIDAVDSPPGGSPSFGGAVAGGPANDDLHAAVNNPPPASDEAADIQTSRTTARGNAPPSPLPPSLQPRDSFLDRALDASITGPDALQRASWNTGSLEWFDGSDEILASGRLDAEPGSITSQGTRIRLTGTGTTAASDAHPLYDGALDLGRGEAPGRPTPANPSVPGRGGSATTTKPGPPPAAKAPADTPRIIPGSEPPPTFAHGNPRPALDDHGASWSDEAVAASKPPQAGGGATSIRNADPSAASPGRTAPDVHSPFTGASNPLDAPVIRHDPSIPVVPPALPSQRIADLRGDPSFDDQWGRLVHRREASHQYSSTIGYSDAVKNAPLNVESGLHKRAYDELQTTVEELSEAIENLLAPIRERYDLENPRIIPQQAGDDHLVGHSHRGFLEAHPGLRLRGRDQYLEVMEALAKAADQDRYDEVQDLLFSDAIRLGDRPPSLRNRALALLEQMEQALAQFDAEAVRKINQAIETADETDGWRGIPLGEHHDPDSLLHHIEDELLDRVNRDQNSILNVPVYSEGTVVRKRFDDLFPRAQAEYVKLTYQDHLYRKAAHYVESGVNPLPYLQEEILHGLPRPVGPFKIDGTEVEDLRLLVDNRDDLFRAAESVYEKVEEALRDPALFDIYENITEGAEYHVTIDGQQYRGVVDEPFSIVPPATGPPLSGGFVDTLDALPGHIEPFRADPRHAASAEVLLTAERNATELANMRLGEVLRGIGEAEPPPNLPPVEVRGRLLELRNDLLERGEFDDFWAVEHTINRLDSDISSLVTEHINTAEELARFEPPPLPSGVDRRAVVADLTGYQGEARERALQMAIKRPSDFDDDWAGHGVFFPDAPDDVVPDEAVREFGGPSATGRARWDQAERAYQRLSLYAAMIEEVERGRDPRYILDYQLRLAQERGADAADLADLQRIRREVHQALGLPVPVEGAAIVDAGAATRPTLADPGAAAPYDESARVRMIAEALRHRADSGHARGSGEVAAILDARPGIAADGAAPSVHLHVEGASVVVSGAIGTPVRLDEAHFDTEYGHVGHIEAPILPIRNRTPVSPRHTPSEQETAVAHADKEDLLFARLPARAGRESSSNEGDKPSVEFPYAMSTPGLEHPDITLRLDLPPRAQSSATRSAAIATAASRYFQDALQSIALTFFLRRAGRPETARAALHPHDWSRARNHPARALEAPAAQSLPDQATHWPLLHALRERTMQGHVSGTLEQEISQWGAKNAADAFHGWFDRLIQSMGSGGHDMVQEEDPI